MAYSTGSGSTIADLLSAVKSFAEGQGWTTDAYTAGVLWSAHKGICYVNFGVRNGVPYQYGTNIGTIVNDLGVPISTSMNIFSAALSSSYSSGVLTYWGQPGSPSSINQSPYDVLVTNLTGPFVEWFMFSGGGGDPDYVHVVVQTGGDTYKHFSFGMADKKGMTHAGCAYLVGDASIFWKNAGLYTGPGPQAYPFVGGNYNESSAFGGPRSHYAPDALPATPSWVSPFFGHFRPQNTSNLTTTGSLRTLSPVNQPSLAYGAKDCALLDPVLTSAASPWSGVSPMWSMPIIADSALSGVARCYLGDYPNVRILDMTTLTHQEELSLSGDTWKLFPALRQENWSTSVYNVGPSTGQLGFAYKKIP